MLRTKLLISSITQVPREWIYEYYLKLPEKLTGQDVTIKSIFNPKDKTPSMCIYVCKIKKVYMFKDFSSGLSGDGVNLIQNMFKLLTLGEAAHKIMQEYNEFILHTKEDYSLREFKVYSKYKVQDFVKRSWLTTDQKYWNRFYIGSKLLEMYNVCPLESYRMTKDEDGELKELVIKGNYIYGYFKSDGTLYKIYQPYVKDKKFLKVKDYIQGIEQLKSNVPYLVICSSLKDLMDFTKLGFKNAEAIAPDSENVIISEHIIHALKNKYKSICTLFDNDEPGRLSMQKYKDRYDINSVVLNLEKDLSDSVEKHGVHVVKETLIPLLTRALKKEVIPST